MLEQPAVPHEGRVGGRGGNKKAGVTVQKSKADKVGTDKTPGGAKDRFRRGPGGLFFQLPLQMPVGKIINLIDVAADVRVRVMEQIAIQRGLDTFDFHRAMLGSPAPFSRLPAKETQNTVRIPIAVRNPPAEEPRFAGKLRGGNTLGVLLKKSHYRTAQFGRNNFISIERKHPGERGIAKREILLLAKAGPGMAVDLAAERGDHGLRAILHVGIENDDNFARPIGNAGQAFANAMGLGPGNNANGYGQFVHNDATAASDCAAPRAEMPSFMRPNLHRRRLKSGSKTPVFLSPAARRPANKSGMAGPSVNNFLERSRGAKKIIVVDFGFLGDSIHLIPALWEIKRHYPGAEVHTLSAVVGAEVLKLAPCVDHTWAFPLTPQSPPWWRNLGIIRDLRREQFDVAFNFSGADRTIFVTALLGARHTLAHEAGRKHFWNHWLGAEWVERRSRQLPVFEQRRQVLAAGGFSLEPPRFDLAIPNEARQWAESNIAGRPIHFSISASSPVKEWPLENWAELANELLKTNSSLTLVATAGTNPREQTRLKEMTRIVDNKRLQCLEGLSIARLAAVLQRCRLHVGADSGALHLAFALGVPTLTVFRRYEGLAEWMPAGEKHRHLVTECACIDQGRDDCLRAGRSACLASIAPASVCELARETF